MNNNSLFRIGVIVYALVIGVFGINHFLKVSTMQSMVPSFLPGGAIWVYITGLALVAAAVSFLTGKYTRLAGILLCVFLLAIVLAVHLPAVMHAPDENASRFPMTNLMKDIGLAAGALMIAGKA